MYGRYGADEMRGGDNADTLLGGYGDDRIYAGPGVDTGEGEAGSDFIRAVDGQRGSISCGIGNDRAIIDEADLDRAGFEDFVRQTSCEGVRVS
jgi:Ca2+-binding RTX toxin-like protein